MAPRTTYVSSAGLGSHGVWAAAVPGPLHTGARPVLPGSFQRTGRWRMPGLQHPTATNGPIKHLPCRKFLARQVPKKKQG